MFASQNFDPYEINMYDLIDNDYFEYMTTCNKELLRDKMYINKITNDRNKIIKEIGISGINKVSFFNELNKLNHINFQKSDESLYFHIDHNIYDSYAYTKINENNIYHWIKINNNTIPLLDYMYILFNKH